LKLADLNPRRYRQSQAVDQSEIAPGITFDCPCCAGTDRAIRLAVQVNPPFDPLHQIDEWQIDPAALYVKDRTIWSRSGDTWETMTLTPSIDASQHGHWHGFITNGEIR
jgi:hypothetical protein